MKSSPKFPTVTLPTWRSFLFSSRTAVSFWLAFLIGLGAAGNMQAQFLSPLAQISSQPAGGGLYNYSISLQNNPGSASSIETFWFSWLPGLDFLPSQPGSVQPPAGWNYSIQGGPYSYLGYTYPDGYSIEFTSSTGPIAPGASLNFKFVSSDSPSALAGTSSIYPGYQILTSFIYSGIGESGFGSQFQVQVVPEPGALALLIVGLAALFLTPARFNRESVS